MKYEITYNTKYGHGTVTVNGNENDVNLMVTSLKNNGCRDISHKMVRDYDDPCEFCHRDHLGCYGCEHAGK